MLCLMLSWVTQVKNCRLPLPAGQHLLPLQPSLEMGCSCSPALHSDAVWVPGTPPLLWLPCEGAAVHHRVLSKQLWSICDHDLR